MNTDNAACKVKGVYFDFGGVIAEEGYRKGLKAIAEKNGVDPDDFFEKAHEIMKESGYLVGREDETAFWRRLHFELGIQGTNEELRNEILSRFKVRGWVIAIADAVKFAGLATGILSDQTNWLDELDEKYGFMRHFDVVINSYHFGKSKLDGTIFRDAAEDMGLAPGEILFIDDDKGHLSRAAARGVNTLHFDFDGPDGFIKALKDFCPGLEVER